MSITTVHEQWEYLARNLAKVPGMSLERDFNKHGADGWEFVAVADGYAIFKRRQFRSDHGGERDDPW